MDFVRPLVDFFLHLDDHLSQIDRAATASGPT